MTNPNAPLKDTVGANGKKIGRPRSALPQNAVAIVQSAVAEGVSEPEIARRLGVSYPIWKNHRDKDEAIQAVWEEGRDQERDDLVNHLKAVGLGQKEASNQSVVSCIFLLKARHHYRDIGEAVARDGGTNVVINLPSAMSDDQYRKLVQVSPITVPQGAVESTRG